MPVIRRLSEKTHVVGIEMKGVDERNRFVVQCVDIAAESPIGLADSRANR